MEADRSWKEDTADVSDEGLRQLSANFLAAFARLNAGREATQPQSSNLDWQTQRTTTNEDHTMPEIHSRSEASNDSDATSSIDDEDEDEETGDEGVRQIEGQILSAFARLRRGSQPVSLPPSLWEEDSESTGAHSDDLGDSSSTGSGRLCAVCLDRESDSVIKPCHHANVCRRCVRIVFRMARADGKEPACPTCRKAIRKTRRVYY